MGEHKTNQTAIAAANGELPPKPKKMSKKELDALLMNCMNETLQKRNLLFANYIDPVYKIY